MWIKIKFRLTYHNIYNIKDKESNMKLKRILIVCIAIMTFTILLTDCVKKKDGWGKDGPPKTFRLEYFAGKRVGITEGTIQAVFQEIFLPDVIPVFFHDSEDGIVAMKNGTIDAYYDDEASFRLYVSLNPGLRILQPFVTSDNYAVMVAQRNDDLRNKLNEFIMIIKGNGVYDEMINRWLDEAHTLTVPIIPRGHGEVIHFGTSGIINGFSFYVGDQLVGFDIEFAQRFALYLDRELDIIVMDFRDLIAATEYGHIDFAASLFTITEERKTHVDFSMPYYTGGSVIAVFEP